MKLAIEQTFSICSVDAVFVFLCEKSRTFGNEKVPHLTDRLMVMLKTPINTGIPAIIRLWHGLPISESFRCAACRKECQERKDKNSV